MTRVRRFRSKLSSEIHKISSKNDIFIRFFTKHYSKAYEIDPRRDQKSQKRDWNFHFSRNPIEKPTRLAPSVPNDPLFGSKVITDEPGRLGRPAWPAGRARPARAGQPGRLVPPGRPGGLLCGRGTKGECRRRAAHRRGGRPPTPITAGGLFGIYSPTNLIF